MIGAILATVAVFLLDKYGKKPKKKKGKK